MCEKCEKCEEYKKLITDMLSDCRVCKEQYEQLIAQTTHTQGVTNDLRRVVRPAGVEQEPQI